jgi:hypothetical protein
MGGVAPLRLLYTTSNKESNPKKVISKAAHYDNEIYWLHLDGRFRGGNIARLGEAYDEVFQAVVPPPEHLPIMIPKH